MNSSWIRAVPKSSENVHIRGRRKHTFSVGEETDVKMEAETGVRDLQVTECQGLSNHQKLGDRHGWFLLQSFQKESTLPTL